jgi:hypothetical protein
MRSASATETRLHVAAEGSEGALLAELYRVHPGTKGDVPNFPNLRL